MATAESVAGSCGTATSWSSVLCSSASGSCVATAESLAGPYGAVTCCTSSWVSKFGRSAAGSYVTIIESIAGSCATTTFSERDEVTKSWASCISVPEGETGKDSGTWDCGEVWGLRLIGGEFGMVAAVAASVDVLVHL